MCISSHSVPPYNFQSITLTKYFDLKDMRLSVCIGITKNPAKVDGSSAVDKLVEFRSFDRWNRAPVNRTREFPGLLSNVLRDILWECSRVLPSFFRGFTSVRPPCACFSFRGVIRPPYACFEYLDLNHDQPCGINCAAASGRLDVQPLSYLHTIPALLCQEMGLATVSHILDHCVNDRDTLRLLDVKIPGAQVERLRNPLCRSRHIFYYCMQCANALCSKAPHFY